MKLKNRVTKLENLTNIKKDFLQYLLIVNGKVLNNNELISEDEFYKQNPIYKNEKAIFKLRVKKAL